MSLWKQLSFWLKDTFQSRGSSVKDDTNLSRTIRDATDTRGAGGQGGGLGPSEGAIEHALKGHKDYQKSFKKNE